MIPKTKQISDSIIAFYRPDTSDERVLTEVIDNRIYRRKKIDFDVYPGELWLDLGANIGAFALYCRLRGAVAMCFEPDPDCFKLLQLNAPSPPFALRRTAVTNRHEPMLPFWKGKRLDDHYRSTAFPTPALPPHPSGDLPNMHGSELPRLTFDGIKMDVEGAEFGLLDDDLLPPCKKLCMEYHTSRDASANALKRRMDYLRQRFKVVSYPPEYDRIIHNGVPTKTYFDRMVFAKDAISINR